MRFVNPDKNWLSRLLVLLLLLSAQSFLMAHELTHVPYGDSGVLCDICSAGHGLDSGVTAVLCVPVSECTHDLQVLESPTGHDQALIFPYIARAPPLKDVF
jgi:hypothetical protein